MARRMRAVEGWKYWGLKQIVPRSSPEFILANRREGEVPFFFADARSLGVALKSVLGATGEASALADANQILEGTLPYFGALSFACGFPPRWFENPATGQRVSPDDGWTGMRFASDDYGDLKFILEPSRFLFVYPLARAYAVSGDERFAEAFWMAMEDWAGKNPPMSGPLWICGQECSLRILAWSFGLYSFLDSTATTPERIATLFSMISAHAWRILQTIGYARSQRSNHLISEAVGLWTAGTLYPELKDSGFWRNRGAQLLREAVLDQITMEGAYLQDSFNYQRMVLHQLLWTIRLAEIHEVKIDPEIRKRAIAAFDFFSGFVDAQSGFAPNHGSNDGSHILPLSACDNNDFRPLLRLGSSVLDRPTTLEAGPWDEAPVWFGDRNAKQSESAKNISSIATAASVGYHRIGTKKAWAMVRAGHYTRRPFQADQLHVDLWWHGLNLARDAGTYLYNGDPPWNNGLAGTAVHNTVTVDGRDQMRRAGRFLWVDWAQASGRSFSSMGTGFPDRFEGEHDGYRESGVKHRRRVDAVTEDAWIIVDDLVGTGEHDLRLHWLLPDLPIEVTQGPPFAALLKTGEARFRWEVFSSVVGETAVVRGGKKVAGHSKCVGKDEVLLGWESPTYGKLCPAISLVCCVHAAVPVRFVTAIVAGEGLQVQESGRQLMVSRAGAELYRVGLDPAESAMGSG